MSTANPLPLTSCLECGQVIYAIKFDGEVRLYDLDDPPHRTVDELLGPFWGLRQGYGPRNGGWHFCPWAGSKEAHEALDEEIAI